MFLRKHQAAGRDRAEGEEIVTPLAEPTDLELIRKIATTGGTKYTAGNIDRGKYQCRSSLPSPKFPCKY